MTYVTDIKKAKNEGKLIIGAKRTFKKIMSGEIKKIYLANNCPEDIHKKLENLKKINKNIEINILSIDNIELGTLCKKPFSVSCLGIKSDTKD